MLEKLFFGILKGFVRLFGVIISPILALFPSVDLSGLTATISGLISQGIGVSVYLLGPAGYSLIITALTIRVLMWTYTPLKNVVKKIPYVNQLFG